MNNEHFGRISRAAAFMLLASALVRANTSLAEDTAKRPIHFSESVPLRLYDGLGCDINRPYDLPGIEAIQAKATGFFHVKQIGGKWWLIDPNGKGYWHAALLGVGFGKFGWRGAAKSDPVVSRFETPESYIRWVQELLARGRFNGTSQWANNTLAGPLPFTRLLNGIQGFYRYQNDGNMEYKLSEGPGWHDVPNPFHPEFEAFCDREAELNCEPFKNSPWLIGWQLTNERNWFGTELAGKVMRYPASHHGKIALVSLAEKQFSTIDAFNHAWGTTHTSFDALLQSRQAPDLPPTPEATAFAWRFLEHSLDTFLTKWASAIRKHDPNHLVVGLRQHGHETPGLFNRGFWEVMGKHCDIITLNAYAGSIPVDPQQGVPTRAIHHFREISELTGRPIINSEWFPNVDHDRVFRSYQSFMISHDSFVGSQLFQLFHEDGSRLSYLDPKTFQPHPDLERAAVDIHGNLIDLRLNHRPEEFCYEPAGLNEWNVPLPPARSGVLPLTVTNGPLAFIRHKKGWKITHDGKPFTSFEPLVHQVINGQNRWAKPESHRIEVWYENNDFLVIDSRFGHSGHTAAGVNAGGSTTPPAGEKPAFAYDMRYRLWLPKQHPNAYIGQCLSIRNMDQQTWLLKNVMHSHHTALGGDGSDDEMIRMKSIYSLSGWLDRKANLAWASFSPDKRMTGRTLIFKHNGRRNASCDEPKNAILVGAQSIAFDQPATVYCMAWDPTWNSDRVAVVCEAMVEAWSRERSSRGYVSKIAP